MLDIDLYRAVKNFVFWRPPQKKLKICSNEKIFFDRGDFVYHRLL